MALLAATRHMGKKFYVLCGEDALTFSSLCLGGDGAIAAVGHVIGAELHEMMQAFARGDYKDPGPYKYPKESRAYEWTGESLNPHRAPTSRMKELDPVSGRSTGAREVILDVRKPGGHKGH